ncbi:unnamed protein product [Arctogadus glacialis]
MESAITKLVDVFKSYAGKDKQLGTKEFRKLVRAELKNLITCTEDDKAVDDLKHKTDKNNDGKISFEEYFILVTELATKIYKLQ